MKKRLTNKPTKSRGEKSRAEQARRRPNMHKKLAVETLESRRMLAADLDIFHNVEMPEDVNGNGRVETLDALIVIDEVRHGRYGGEGQMVDVNADGRVNVLDGLHAIRRVVDGEQAEMRVEDRIASLTSAIENGTLPEFISIAKAERMLERLNLRLEHLNAEDPDLNTEGESEVNDQGEQETGEQETGDGSGEQENELPEGETAGEGDEHGQEDALTFDEQMERVFNRLDRNDDGSLTSDELPERIWDRVAQADENADEAVSLEEFQAEANEFRVDAIEHAFDHADENDDSAITEDETTESRWERLVTYDADGNQQISLDESTTAIDEGVLRLGPKNHDYIPRPDDDRDRREFDGAALFARLDANEDGELTQDEIPAFFYEELIPADSDGNGSLTLAELQAYRDKTIREQIDDLFAEIDKNADAAITQSDVGMLPWRFMQRGDEDDDGQLSGDEFADFFNKFGGRFGLRL